MGEALGRQAMTALDQYERLEAAGVYTPGPDAQRLNVILSIGSATLTITDHREVALAHWSLAALERMNPGQRPALYGPAAESPERIETADETMITAIEKVRRAVERARPHPGRLRLRLTMAVAAVGLAIAVFWLPGALVRTTAGIVPKAGRAAISAAVLDEVARITGLPCAEPAGRVALDRLVARLSPFGPPGAVVLPGGAPGARLLPDGSVLLNRGVVEDHETPEVAAGYLLAEAARAETEDPLIPLLEHAGLAATMRLATTGALPDRAVARYAEHLMTTPNPPLADAALTERFAGAGISTSDYAFALDITGENTLPLVEADPLQDGAGTPVLGDGDWVALQGVCGA